MKKQSMITTMSRMLMSLLTAFALPATNLFAPPMTYIVSNTNDSGAGSLRQAILDSNANNPGPGGQNTIQFSVAGQIIPVTDLPPLTQPVLIDGYTAPAAVPNTNPITAGNNANITVELIGPGAGLLIATEPINGLDVQASNCEIRGLCINNFARVTNGGATYGAGILVESSASSTDINGNFIGSDTTGLQSFPNATAINVQGTNTIIGGSGDNTARNLLSGHYLGGSGGGARINGVIRITGDNTSVMLNTIGLNKPGTAALMPDAHQGVTSVLAGSITGTGTTIIGGINHLDEGNVISGHRAGNVYVDHYFTSHFINNNYIGTDVTGTVAITGNGNGVVISRADVNQPIDRANNPLNIVINGNLISGNTYGVKIGNQNFSGFPVYNAQVTDNFIGTDVTGAVALPNSLDGIWVKFALNTYIFGNLISANGRNGIRVGKAQNTIIRNNKIGTDESGSANLGNGGNGIQLGINVGVGVTAFNDVVGGAKPFVDGFYPGDGNLIAFNTGNGIEIVGYTQQETIQGNTITNNQLNGILIDPNASNNWIGGFRTAGDERLMGDIASQQFANLGPLGTSNLISNNRGEGIKAVNSNANAIQTNIINLNGGNGVSLTDSSNNLVGGKFGSAATTTPPVLGNVIIANNGFGVAVIQDGGNATDNSILSNSIFDNSSLGINLITL